MATQIQLTRSGVSGEQPDATEIELGELALNYADGKLFFKNSSNNIEQLNSTYNNSGQKIFVNEADNYIGLNTVLPEFLLDLGGNSASADNSLRLNQNDDGTAIRIGGSANGDITLLRVDNADGETDDSAEGFSIKYLGTNPNNELGIFADNSGTEVQALTILQDGKVGIQTGTPTKELDVNGSAIVQANLDVVGGVTIGVDDTTNGTLSILGGGAGNLEGGEIRLYTAADHDSAYGFYRLDTNSDAFRIGRQGQTDLTLDSSGNLSLSGSLQAFTITGTTLTDGTASISGGAITGATNITASGNVTALDPTQDTHLATKAYVDSTRPEFATGYTTLQESGTAPSSGFLIVSASLSSATTANAITITITVGSTVFTDTELSIFSGGKITTSIPIANGETYSIDEGSNTQIDSVLFKAFA